jgi:hypothetical protein
VLPQALLPGAIRQAIYTPEPTFHVLHKQLLRQRTEHADGKQTTSASCLCASARRMSTEVVTATTGKRQHLRSKVPQQCKAECAAPHTMCCSMCRRRCEGPRALPQSACPSRNIEAGTAANRAGRAGGALTAAQMCSCVQAPGIKRLCCVGVSTSGCALAERVYTYTLKEAGRYA